ncbi:hypothetical protein ACFLS8_03895 [Chloroflexota bacterium]
MCVRISLTIITLITIIALVVGCGPVSTAGDLSSTSTVSTIPSSDQTSPTITTITTMPSVTQTTTPSATQLTMLSITQGTVLLMKEGTDTWIEAQVGMSLEPSDRIKTGDDSNALITFFEGNTIELLPGTQIEINSLDFVEATGSFAITLQQEIGKTVSRITRLTDTASSYNVVTTAGVAAVLGSAMLVEVNINGVTWVSNLHGGISASAQGVGLQIPEGMTGKIIPGEPPILVEHTRDNSDDGNSNT